ncbi:hypothetical protein Tsubulata_024075 [Turnera subulata]|uniref:Filament-like plant protein 7 n=1 Tax=Turnera subulata TaxID=218843 RepID=A0A9Q0J2J8_9ROSI|nr:hypothetical protein Tsubulata_024075 [Turnera subulata]
MDNKSWLWRKKSSEKTIVATNKFGNYARGINEETKMLPAMNEVVPPRAVRNLNEKLASVILECQAKDDLKTKNESLTQEASTGQEKAEAEAVTLRKQLDEAQRQVAAANEKLTLSDASLKQCMQQLCSLREEQEQKIHNAVMKASNEFEKAQKNLEEKLIETSKRLANVAVENTNLSNALIVKEKLVEELHRRSSQTVAEFNALMSRLDSAEKENAFLKYEFHMLEKELEVRTEELEYNRRSAEAIRRQHLESVRKVTKLEAECQRLKVLMRKRLSGPAAIAKMKSEVEMLGREPMELSRKPNPVRDLLLKDTVAERTFDIPAKNINFLIEQLRGMEEENKSLKETVTKKNAELQSSRVMFSRTASRLSQVEAQVMELSGGQKSMELVKYSPLYKEVQSPTAASYNGSEDRASSSGSWANALISELENFREEKLKSPLERKAIEDLDMRLMDDFVEMEKLAIISVQAPSGNENHPLLTGKELVSVEQCPSGSAAKQDSHSVDADDSSFDWLQEVLNAILKQQRISKQSLSELVEDIKIALGLISHPNDLGADATEFSRHSVPSDIKSPRTSFILDPSNGSSIIDIFSKETSRQTNQSSLSKPIRKIMELIEGINLKQLATNDYTEIRSKADQNSLLTTPPENYFSCIFQWKSSELDNILQRFIRTCDCLLSGKASLENFAEELHSTLDWIVSNHLAVSDHDSTSRAGIKRDVCWKESQAENGVRVPVVCPLAELDAVPIASSHGLQDQEKGLKDELNKMELAKEGKEPSLQALMIQDRESLQRIESLQQEVEMLKESKGMLEEQMENQKSINEDLDTQLTVAKAKLNEVLQKFSCLEVELEDKVNCCEELEATCLELQLELESGAKMETQNRDMNEEGKQPQNGWEITAASVKLAECQETILNLGKQLKALASPREAALFDRVFNTTSSTTTGPKIRNFHKRFSLRDQMIAEDRSKAIILRSPAENTQKPTSDNFDNSNALVCAPGSNFGSNHRVGDTPVGTLAIVPAKKHGGFGFIRKIIMRRKKASSKKARSTVKL